MEQDFQWLSICGQDDQFGYSTIESFSGLVCAFFDLLLESSLSDQLYNLVGHLSIGQGSGTGFGRSLFYFFTFLFGGSL